MQTNKDNRLFSSKALITSDEDLKFYLRRMPNNCNTLVNKGQYILHFDRLNTIPMQDIKNKKIAIILNTNHSKESPNTTGHWVTILINKERKCLFIDSLKKGSLNSKIIESVKIFCNIHNLHFTNWKIRTQRQQSQACGFIILFFINCFAKYNMFGFTNLKKLFTHYSINERERYILKKAYKLCTE